MPSLGDEMGQSARFLGGCLPVLALGKGVEEMLGQPADERGLLGVVNKQFVPLTPQKSPQIPGDGLQLQYRPRRKGD